MPYKQKSFLHKNYHRIIRLFLLAIFGLSTVLSVPVLSTQFYNHTPTISQTSNAQSLLQQGIISYQAGNYPQALNIWQQALQEFSVNGEQLNQALVLSNLSLAYQHLGQFKEAEEAIYQSLEILNNLENIANYPKYTAIFAKTLNAQARLQWAKGALETALKTWQNATIYYTQAGDEKGIIGCWINQAQALQAMGLNLKAEEKFQAITAKLDQQSDPYLQATGWLNLGKTLRRIGRLKGNNLATPNADNIELQIGSLEALEKSRAEAQKLNNSTLKISVLLELGNTQRALANRSITLEQAQETKDYYQAALEAYQQAAEYSSPLKLKAQLNILNLLVEMGNYSLLKVTATNENQGLTELKKLVTLIQEQITQSPLTHTKIFDQLNFAHSLTCLQAPPNSNSPWCPSQKSLQKQSNRDIQLVSWSEIAQTIAGALTQARTLEDIQAQSYALGQLGGVYELNQQWEDAQKLTEQAISTIEDFPAPHLLYRWEWQLGRLLEKQGKQTGAISAYQAAVSTLGTVTTDLVYVDSDLQFSFQENIEPLYRKLIDLLLPETPIIQGGETNLLAARDNIQLLQRAELESFLRCSLQDIRTKQVDDLVDYQDSTEAVIYPILLEERIGIILRLPNSEQLLAYSSPLGELDLDSILANLERDLRFAGRKKAVQKNAQTLYQLIIQPLEDKLAENQINTLVFLLDAPFRNIPMSVLYDGEQYLIEKYSVAITSGLELLESQTVTRGNFQAALAGVSKANQGFSALPNVLPQFEEIGSEINTQAIVDEDFTVESLQNLLNSLPFPVIHIATHGQFSSQPEETFLVAWNDKISVNRLRSLLRSRAETRPEPVELLVLAACETSQGDKRAALGLAGIAVNSGARSTLATLWKIIADESPGSVFSTFYKQLRDEPQITKAQALRNAQLELLGDSNTNAPYYWAPYVLIGNWL